MAAEAAANKEVLEKHGLSESASGRLAHVGAGSELDALAAEMVQVVKVMDGLNRTRFARGSETLAAWESARNVVAAPRPATDGPPATPAEPVKAAA